MSLAVGRCAHRLGWRMRVCRCGQQGRYNRLRTHIPDWRHDISYVFRVFVHFPSFHLLHWKTISVDIHWIRYSRVTSVSYLRVPVKWGAPMTYMSPANWLLSWCHWAAGGQPRYMGRVWEGYGSAHVFPPSSLGRFSAGACKLNSCQPIYTWIRILMSIRAYRLMTSTLRNWIKKSKSNAFSPLQGTSHLDAYGNPTCLQCALLRCRQPQQRCCPLSRDLS